MPFLGFLLPRPFAGRGLDGIDDVVGDVARAAGFLSQSSGCSASSVRMIELLPRSAYWMYADARCSAQITGWLALARTLARVFSSPSPVDPKRRNGLLIPALQFAPVTNLRDTRAPSLRQPGLMQPEGKLDDVGNAVAGHAFAALIFESVDVAARCQESLLEMLDADDAKMLGGNRLAVLPHRRQQLGDALAIDLIDAEELRQRLMRAAYLGQYLALNGSAGEPTELADELAHRAVLPELAIPGHVRGEIALQP